jgi:glutamate 5-kinase
MLFHNQRVVIKVGSALLINSADGTLNIDWMRSLAEEIITLRHDGCQVVVVTSGAVGLGCYRLKFLRRVCTLEHKQAAAAVGQIELIQTYQKELASHGLLTAQVLLTLDDSENRRRFLNARNTLTTLLDEGIIPIVNENDTVATDEIKYGDNDRLAARVSQMIEADTLILLSDVDGLYDTDPHKNPKAKRIEEVNTIDEKLLAIAGDSVSDYGSGGMKTKLAAAQIVMSYGIKMLITEGKPLYPIRHFKQHGKGTWFKPLESSLKSKKAWLKNHLKPKGQLIIDDGAQQALLKGKSLLPVGIVKVLGHFQKGDVVSIVSENGQELARGLSNYPFDEVKLIRGRSSLTIYDVLGYSGMQEVVHCDNLVVIKNES